MNFRDSIIHFDKHLTASGASLRIILNILENKNKKENNNQSGLQTQFGPMTFRDSIIHIDKYANNLWSQFQDNFQHWLRQPPPPQPPQRQWPINPAAQGKNELNNIWSREIFDPL